MKKNLIALAIFGAFSGAALAQSNVTLYGIIDVGLHPNPDSARHQGITAAPRPQPLGVRGSEALSPH